MMPKRPNSPPGGFKKETRGSAGNIAEPRFLVIGRIIKPHGIRGELKVESFTDTPERFSWLEKVYLEEENGTPLMVEEVRFHQNWVLIKFTGIDDRTAAESLRRSWLFVPMDEAVPLAEDEYFLFQLIGLQVINQHGDQLGEIHDVIETQANNVFVVRTSRNEHLIPDIPDVIREIDFEKMIMTIEEFPGLIVH